MNFRRDRCLNYTTVPGKKRELPETPAARAIADPGRLSRFRQSVETADYAFFRRNQPANPRPRPNAKTAVEGSGTGLPTG